PPPPPSHPPPPPHNNTAQFRRQRQMCIRDSLFVIQFGIGARFGYYVQLSKTNHSLICLLYTSPSPRDY
ncbi:hypothetical protein ACRTEE_23335, partial [Vibrio alginolyticus]|uniref:hypothetical protein n=1 Tax=Vibrio alginolyticus TaxID=663 RepID=UPI003D7E9378